MLLKATITRYLKAIFSDVRQAIVGAIVLALVGGTAGLLYLSKSLLSFSIQIANTPTPLWATVALVLVLGIYVRSRRHTRNLSSDVLLHQAFGVSWDTDFNMHCLSCGTLLKNSTLSPSIFFCSDPRCNSKYILKDDDGKELTKQGAINILKGQLTT